MYSDIAFFGAQLVQAFQSDCTAFQVGEALDNFLLSSTIDFYHTVITRRAPVSEASRFIIGGKEARYRSLVVPLSTDGNTIDYLIGTANFRIFD
ncbi:MAG: hypothetical protein IT567_04055 [Alphaproteobacteria bacterium]|nr:hypothetical protein [Alphaproteobacteria bacterium]